MSTMPERPRKQRRQEERSARKTVRQKERLTTLLPGGDAAHPIEVSAASVVEIQARAMRCIQCDGDLELRSERASSTARGVLRELGMICRRCHAPRRLWFRLTPMLPS